MKAGITILLILLASACSMEKSSASLEQELMDTDRAFSALSLEKGSNAAFLAYCESGAILLRENSLPVVGESEVKNLLLSRPDTSFSLSWEPLGCRVAASGELGFTYGTYELEVKGSEGLRKGTYVSIWAREDGKWKWVLDSGNEGLGE